MSDRVYHLTVLALTDSGVRCSTGDGEALWLPKASVTLANRSGPRLQDGYPQSIVSSLAMRKSEIRRGSRNR
jgi:hypothetical protein